MPGLGSAAVVVVLEVHFVVTLNLTWKLKPSKNKDYIGSSFIIYLQYRNFFLFSLSVRI